MKSAIVPRETKSCNIAPCGSPTASAPAILSKVCSELRHLARCVHFQFANMVLKAFEKKTVAAAKTDAEKKADVAAKAAIIFQLYSNRYGVPHIDK